MRDPSALERLGHWTLALAIGAVTAIAPLTPVARAQDASNGAAVVDSPTSPAPIETERWWGAVGTILCATEVRLIRVVPAIGLNPYVLAAGLGGCLLAVMDIITTE